MMQKLFVTLASLAFFSLCAVMTMADEAGKRKKVEFEVHTPHFVKSDAGLEGTLWYLVFADYSFFDQVFGTAMTMEEIQPIPVEKDTFDKNLVITVIKKGNVIYNYKVNSVTAEGDKLYVQYTIKEEVPGYTSTFLSPMVISVANNDYTSVVYIEDGKTVKTVEEGYAEPEETTEDE